MTLDDLGRMVRQGEDFVVYDAKTGEDITRSVLTQIIFEEENKDGSPNLLPITFLRQLIRFYGDSMQALVPSYLEFSMENLARDQQKLREQMAQTFGPGAFHAIEEQVRDQHGLLHRGDAHVHALRRRSPRRKPRRRRKTPQSGGDDLDALRRQMVDMQARLEALSKK